MRIASPCRERERRLAIDREMLRLEPRPARQQLGGLHPVAGLEARRSCGKTGRLRRRHSGPASAFWASVQPSATSRGKLRSSPPIRPLALQHRAQLLAQAHRRPYASGRSPAPICGSRPASSPRWRGRIPRPGRHGRGPRPPSRACAALASPLASSPSRIAATASGIVALLALDGGELRHRQPRMVFEHGEHVAVPRRPIYAGGDRPGARSGHPALRHAAQRGRGRAPAAARLHRPR